MKKPDFYSRRLKSIVLGALLTALPLAASAGYSCTGVVTFLGIEGDGDLTIQLSGSTPIHMICNVNSQGPFAGFSVESCKIAYGAALAAHLTGKTLTVFYNDQLTCATQPTWGESFGAYFVQGPD